MSKPAQRSDASCFAQVILFILEFWSSDGMENLGIILRRHDITRADRLFLSKFEIDIS